MFAKLQSYLNYGTAFCSVEVSFVSGGEKLFAVTAKKKNEEFVALEFIDSSSFSELAEGLSKGQHCFLTINTDKVLIKEVSFDPDNQKVLAKAFPSLSISDFFYEILKTKDKCFVAVTRKDYVMGILAEAEKQKMEILGFSLGFLNVSLLTPLLNEKEVITSRHKISTDSDSIVSFENFKGSSVDYLIDNIQIPSSYLIGLSGLFKYDPHSNLISSNSQEKNKNLIIAFKEKVFFRLGKFSAVGFLLVLLLINFFVFNGYFKEKQSLGERVQLLENQKQNFTSKAEKIQAKQQLADNILKSGSSKSSFFINRLVSGKPSTVLFNQTQYQPLLKSIRSNKKIAYTKKEIVIHGESSDKKSFSNWMEVLEKKDWITKVTVLAYGISKNNNSNFAIRISIIE